MRYKKFVFKDFRGIAVTQIDLARRPGGRINVLVGLNESGKTTVLEGIHHFSANPNPNLLKKEPSKSQRSPSDYYSILPIGKRALFNGSVKISATIEVEEDDWNKIDEFMKNKFGFGSTKRLNHIAITHELKFENSTCISLNNVWSAPFEGRKPGKGNRKWIALEGDDWLTTASFAQTLLPKIVYFPTAVLQFPDKIIIDNKGKKPDLEPKNEFYCEVLKDILKAIDPQLDLEQHLVARARSSSRQSQQSLAALLQKIEAHLDRTIFSEWEKIFGRKIEGKHFRVNVNGTDEIVSFELTIVDAEGIFSVNERSAGFRWFFVFILLTRYRLHRKDRVLFLFDEPAANLHPNAQTQLLKSFELFAREADIIYSTHSHYLINPLWLESTHIVQNAGVPVDGGVTFDTPVSSSISVTPYRTFVGRSPDQYFYYRPVQEALDYAPSPIEFPDSVVLVEGKTDFFAISYFSRFLSVVTAHPKLFPGGGAGSLDPLISLLSGWGKNFVILVDSDAQGKFQKQRYEDKFEAIVARRIFSIEDIDAAWAGCEIEQLIEVSDAELIWKDRFPAEIKLTKKLLHKAIQELLVLDRRLPISKSTLGKFEALIKYLGGELEKLGRL